MSARFSNLWGCIATWIILDLLMIGFGKELPPWLYFDGREGLTRDFWVVWFIAGVWLIFREPSAPPSTDGKSP